MNPQIDVLTASRCERAAKVSLPGEQADGNALIEQLRHSLRGYLNIPEQQDVVQLVIGKIEEDFIVLLHQKPVARLAQDGTLLSEVEKRHVIAPFGRG